MRVPASFVPIMYSLPFYAGAPGSRTCARICADGQRSVESCPTAGPFVGPGLLRGLRDVQLLLLTQARIPGWASAKRQSGCESRVISAPLARFKRPFASTRRIAFTRQRRAPAVAHRAG